MRARWHASQGTRFTPLTDEPPHIEARINYRLRSDLLMRVHAL